MATKIEQCSRADRVAALTNEYLELGLRPESALGAAEADLWEPERLGLFIQSGSSSANRCIVVGKVILPPNVRR
jgi:hypothetical protein